MFGTLQAGEIVRRVRHEATLTQADLADRIGTTQSAVSRWERGHDEPRLETLARIVRACGFRLRMTVDRDDVDRAQLRQQLALSPERRLASVINVSRTVATARKIN